MKTINFTQEAEVIETYDIDYSESDFEYDCEVFKITNLSFDELCDIMAYKKEVLIEITDFHCQDGNWVTGPHFVDAYDFFMNIMNDQAFDCGPWDTETVSVYNRTVKVETH